MVGSKGFALVLGVAGQVVGQVVGLGPRLAVVQVVGLAVACSLEHRN